jgi:hypothetical protein
MMMSDYANPLTPEVPPSRRAVGGWLLYFCIALTFFGPFKMVQMFQTSEVWYMMMIYAILALTSLVAGVLTWSRSNAAFLWLRIHLLARLFYGFLQAYFAFQYFQYPNLGQSTAIQEAFYSTMNILASIAIFLYFRISSRVDETFGRNI